MKTRPKSKHGKSGAWNKEQKRRFDHIEGKKSQSYWKLGQNEAGSQVPRLDGRLLDDDCFGRSSLEGGNGISESKNPGDPLGRVREDSLSQCVAAGASHAREVIEEDDYRPEKRPAPLSRFENMGRNFSCGYFAVRYIFLDNTSTILTDGLKRTELWSTYSLARPKNRSRILACQKLDVNSPDVAWPKN